MQKNLTPTFTLSRNVLTVLLVASISFVPLVVPTAIAQTPPPIKITTTANPTKAHIGEPITITIKIQWPADGIHIAPLSLPDEIGPFEILDIQISDDKKNKEGQIERTITLTATTFELGPQELGPIEVPYTQNSGELKTLSTPPLTIEILSVLPEGEDAAATAEIRPIAPPLEMPFNRKLFLILSGIVLLLLALAALGLYLIKRYGEKEQKSAVPPAPLLDPDEEALRALAEIETSGLIERDTANALYTRLSHILRRYLGRRHRFDALEMTSTELFETIEQIGWSHDLHQLLDEDLREADAVKFAKYTPNTSKRYAALGRARQIVMGTRPERSIEDVSPAKHIDSTNQVHLDKDSERTHLDEASMKGNE